jgi:glutathione S-transferase
VLRADDLTIWDSWAICAYAREHFPTAIGWPADPEARAIARAVSAEMHAGFLAIRSALPLNCRLRLKGTPLDGDLEEEVARIGEIWRGCRERYGDGGPYLFGAFSFADIMYAPVASRFASYGIWLGETEQTWMDAVLGRDATRAWLEAAAAETEVIERFEP